MRPIDFCLIVISVAVCVPSAITDIRYERIRNILILPALSVGIVKKCAVREYPKSWIGRYQAA